MPTPQQLLALAARIDEQSRQIDELIELSEAGHKLTPQQLRDLEAADAAIRSAWQRWDAIRAKLEGMAAACPYN
jgi:hypothetical protein